MASLRLVAIVLPLVLLGGPAFAQSSPTYGVGRAPTAEEIRRLDISISPTGDELPPGRGTAKEGAEVFEQAGCISCHGETGIGGPAPALSAYCRCARRLRRLCGISSIAACLSETRGVSPPMRHMR
jgi:cytochrome c553